MESSSKACVCVCVCVCARIVHACVRAHMHASLYTYIGAI